MKCNYQIKLNCLFFESKTNMVNVNLTLQFQVSFNDFGMTSYTTAKDVEPSLTFQPFY